jgi:hypothetical protein
MEYFIRFDEDGNIATWGEDMTNAIKVMVPDDWGLYSVNKYVANTDRTALVVRPGWVDPEPEA